MLRSTLAFLVFLGLLNAAAPLCAWEAIAHYQIGVDTGTDPMGRHQNLPDSWPSHYGFLRAWGITEWFAWSHSVQLTGRTHNVPNQPIDASDKWRAGVTMYNLNSTVPGDYGYETALGFLTHVAQDQVVHYDFFRGGSISNWREEHREKERWADCQIYEQINGDNSWDTDGQPLRLPKIDNDGNAELIARAQQVFIASGASIDSQKPATLPRAEDISEVKQRLADLRDEVGKYLNNFNRDWCEQHNKLVGRYDWNISKLHTYYEMAKEKTKEIMTAYPRLGPPAPPQQVAD